MSELSFAEMVDWVDGRASAGTTARVEAALAAGDTRVTGAVAWLRGFRAVAADLPLRTPPPIVAQRLRQHFSRWSRARAALGETPVEVAATLLFDSRRDLAGAGLRTGGGDDPAVGTAESSVHLAYTTDVGDVVLDVARLPGRRVRVRGQVLLAASDAAPVFDVAASGPGFTARSVDGDELGRFELSDLPATADRLWLSNGEHRIELRLDLRPDQTGGLA